VSFFGAAGSFSAGAHGRYYLTDSLSVLGGIAFSQFEEKGVRVDSSPTFGLGLRYDLVALGSSRPFFEVGGIASPFENVRYTRPYASGATLAEGVGKTSAEN
jgi:hypothetical protein